MFVDIPEIPEETGTGEIVPEVTGSGTIEIVDAEIISTQEFLEETPVEEETIEEVSLEMEGRLLYDANGNLIGNMLRNKRQYIYEYDYKNRLIGVDKNIYKKVNGVETDELELVEKMLGISYDPLGRRIQKLFNNGSYRNYTYSGQDIILEENYSRKHKLKNSKQFIYGNSPDDVLFMELTENKTRKETQEYVNARGKTKTRNIRIAYTQTNTYYHEKDHLGSILAITDDTGTILEEYRYDAFGKPYSKLPDGTVTNLNKSPIGNTRFYTGREYNRGLGLSYHRARYYNPTLGRFISRDPIGIADDVNLYSYVKNNPMGFTDVFGLAAKAFVKAYDEFLLAEINTFGIDIQIQGLKDRRSQNQLIFGYVLTSLLPSNYNQKLYELNEEKDKLNRIFKEKEALAMKLHYSRNNLQSGDALPKSIEEAERKEWSTVVASYHQYGITDRDNVKYVSPSGHKEVVFTNQGAIDNSIENRGTYNFFSPNGLSSKKHWDYDVLPYKRWGNAPGDKQIFN